MAKYRKRPVVIEAIQWNGEAVAAIGAWPNNYDVWIEDIDDEGNLRLFIDSPCGVLEAKPGDWIIKGIKGEIYPCEPDIFEATYEKVEE